MIGVCCAYFLAKRGARVIVVERDEVGKAASYTCSSVHVRRKRTLAPLGSASRRLFDELVGTEKLDCSFRRDGYYEIYLTEVSPLSGFRVRLGNISLQVTLYGV